MKIFCIGRNYAEHARELNNEVPKEPVIFMKPKNALVPSHNPVYFPDFTVDLQYECEVVLRICKNGKHIQEKFARRYFDQLSLGIDFTARDLQSQLKAAGLPWEKAKAFDQSAALGELVPITGDMDPERLEFRLDKNGQTVQQGNTADMLFGFDALLAHISRYFTLNIGDLVYTGTPAGVGRLQIGDHLEAYLGGRKLLDTVMR